MNESTSTKRAILRNEIFNITTLNITINKYDLKVFPSFQTLVSLLVKWSGSHLPCGNDDKGNLYITEGVKDVFSSDIAFEIIQK